MHETKKGNRWYFGKKAHVGVDSKTKISIAVAFSGPMKNGMPALSSRVCN